MAGQQCATAGIFWDLKHSGTAVAPNAAITGRGDGSDKVLVDETQSRVLPVRKRLEAAIGYQGRQRTTTGEERRRVE